MAPGTLQYSSSNGEHRPECDIMVVSAARSVGLASTTRLGRIIDERVGEAREATSATHHDDLALGHGFVSALVAIVKQF